MDALSKPLTPFFLFRFRFRFRFKKLEIIKNFPKNNGRTSPYALKCSSRPKPLSLLFHPIFLPFQIFLQPTHPSSPQIISDSLLLRRIRKPTSPWFHQTFEIFNYLMADRKGQHNNTKNKSPWLFNRSVTINSSASAPADGICGDPLNNLYNSPALQRNGSIKSLYSSSFGSLVSAGNSFKGKVRKLCSIFESPKRSSTPLNQQHFPSQSTAPTKSTKLLLTASDSSSFVPKNTPFPVSDSLFKLPGTEDRVVIYFTSLRGIRKTFHDCHSVRMIFRGFRVNLDERDISMDVAYRKELQKVLGENNVSLPQVFVKGKYIGGADVIKQLLEAGELIGVTKGLPLRGFHPCSTCDDVRFVPCVNCSGSRKVFYEDEEQTRRCPECNENGLVRCPLCCT